MIHSIQSLSFAPKHCEGANLFEPRGCVVTFSTSAHGEITIESGSAYAEPAEIHQHIKRAAEALLAQHGEYGAALAPVFNAWV